jgi:hypothetical protein
MAEIQIPYGEYYREGRPPMAEIIVAHGGNYARARF